MDLLTLTMLTAKFQKQCPSYLSLWFLMFDMADSDVLIIILLRFLIFSMEMVASRDNRRGLRYSGPE